MLISFDVENWMSFQKKASLSMVANRERQHSERLSRVKKYKLRVLPVSAIYGGNASGKTNLFKALSFARSLIVDGTLPDSYIPVEKFRLDRKCESEPTSFSFELLIDDTIYGYSFVVTHNGVHEERLVKYLSTKEITLFFRTDNGIKFDETLESDQRLNFVYEGTRDNQLFLTNSVSQKINNFLPVHNWFKYSLALIAPDNRFSLYDQFLENDHPLTNNMNILLSQLDTGITHFGGENIEIASLPTLLSEQYLRQKVQENSTECFFDYSGNQRFIVTRKDDVLSAKKLVTFHNRNDGTEVKFDLRNESDGSKRVIDILPAFLEMSKKEASRVFVIDEIDRSLHSLLIRQLIESYLAICNSENRAQLLFTTHNLLLMDQNIFRRDEIWVTERDERGCSTLFSFNEYKDVRSDKDIRKSYIQGRLGGVPRILFDGDLFNREKCS